MPKLEFLGLVVLDTGLNITGWPDDLSPLGKLKALKTLNVVGSEPSDEAVAQLNKLPNFDTLQLDNYDVGVSNLAPLKNLSNLRTLALEIDVYLDDVRELTALSQVRHLTIKNDSLHYATLNTEIVAGLVNLESLELTLKVPDISPLASLVNLVDLTLKS